MKLRRGMRVYFLPVDGNKSGPTLVAGSSQRDSFPRPDMTLTLNNRCHTDDFWSLDFYCFALLMVENSDLSLKIGQQSYLYLCSMLPFTIGVQLCCSYMLIIMILGSQLTCSSTVVLIQDIDSKLSGLSYLWPRAA